MTINKILRFGILGGLFALTLTPLIVTPSRLVPISLFFPFITGKNFFFRIIVELCFGLWLVLAYREPSVRPQKSWIFYSLSAYLGVMILSTIFGEYPARSFWSNFERMEGLLSYLHAYILFIVAAGVLRTKELWRRLFQTSLGISLLVSVHGFLQLFGKAQIHQSGSRLDASLGNSAYLAVYILFHLFLSAYLFATSKNKWARNSYAIVIALESVILYYTATRGAILGAIIGAIISLIICAWKYPGRLRKTAVAGLAAIAIAILAFVAVRNTAFVRSRPVLARFASLSWNDNSLIGRRQIWSMSWQGFKDKPILGYGPENYPFVFQKYYSPKMYGQEPWFDRAHNVVLDNLIAGGVLGLLAYLSIFAALFYYLVRSKEDWVVKSILAGLLAGYFLQNLTVFDQLISLLLFYLVLAFVQRTMVAEVPVKTAIDREQAWLPAVVLGAAVLTIFSVYYLNLRAINLGRNLIVAISPAADPSVPLAAFDRIFSYDRVTGLSEAREQLLNVSGNVLRDPNVKLEIKQRYADMVLAQMSKQFAENDADARMHLFYGGFLDSIGDRNLAISELEKARQYSPQKQMILIQLGSTYINAGQIDRGLDYFRQAYELAPDYPEARKMYALAALYTGKTALADQILGAERSSLENDDRFISFYLSNKQYERVIKIWQERIAAVPGERQNYLGLAAAYYYAGNRAKAVRTIKDLVKIDPSFAAEGDNLIKQIELGQIK